MSMLIKANLNKLFVSPYLTLSVTRGSVSAVFCKKKKKRKEKSIDLNILLTKNLKLNCVKKKNIFDSEIMKIYSEYGQF